MRVNSKTYSAFATLESGNLAWLKIDQMFQPIIPTVEKTRDFISSIDFTYKQVNKKYYLTEPFKKAIVTAAPKIAGDDKHLKNIPTDCGILFTDAGFTLYLSNPTDKQLKLLCFGFTRDVLTTYGYIDNDFKFGGIGASIKDGKPFNDTRVVNDWLNSTLIALYFIHNCEVEQLIAKPNQKVKNNTSSLKNESKSTIIMLDCRWFTELIRDIPFHVKGHLRWQAHGEKYGKRKLIWVADYEKKGYVRKSQKEVHIQNN